VQNILDLDSICSSDLFFHKGSDEEENCEEDELSRSSVREDESNNTPTYEPGRRKCWNSDLSVYIYFHHVLLLSTFLIIFGSILISQWWVTQWFIGEDLGTDENCNCMTLLQQQKKSIRNDIQDEWDIGEDYHLTLYKTEGDGNCGIYAFRKVLQIKGEG